MILEQLGGLPLDRLVAVGLRARNLHGLAVQLEAVHVLHSIERALLAVEHDKRLSLALQRTLCDYVEDGAVVLEHARERLLHGVDFDPLLEVVDLRPCISYMPTVCNVRMFLRQ